MLKRILSVLMIVVLMGITTGILVGCEDEVKVHRESETTTQTQKPVVTP